MNIKRFLVRCMLIGGLMMLPVTANGAKIESVNIDETAGQILVEGISSTDNAVVEVYKDNALEYMSVIKNIGNDGVFNHSLNIKNPEGFYTVRINDGIAGLSPDERTVYFNSVMSADIIKTNIEDKYVEIGEKITAKASVSNASDDIGVRIFVAFYDKSGKLIGVESSEKSVSYGKSEEAEFEFDVPAIPGISKVKIMLWGENQPPYAKNVEYYVNCNEIYVSLSGDDGNDGSKEQPFKSIERALEEAKKYDKKVVIYLREGRYMLDILELNSDEAGIIISGYPEEKVIVDGAEKIDSSAFEIVKTTDSEYSRLLDEAKGKVYKCDLSAFGITDAGIIPDIKMWGLFEPFDVITVNGEKLHSARYPNEGYDSISTAVSPSEVGEVADRDTASMKFRYIGSRPGMWKTAEDAWLSGYWAYGWAQDNVKISNIATLNFIFNMGYTITTSGSSTYGLTNKFPGGRFYVFNLLEELDSKEEWYVDKNTNTLYLYSESGLEDADIRIATDKKNLISIKNTSDISIRNITIENVKGTGVDVSGSKDISIDNCTIRNIALNGINISGISCGVENCEIYNIGAGGITLTGGNRSLLSSSKNYAVNNSIHDYSLEYRVYRPGIRMTGVGMKVANNEIYNAPHSAIMYTGNEHIIEYNYIHDVVCETSDSGAVYAGQDFLGHGSVIRYNYFENIDTESEPEYGYAAAIYLDDFYGGASVYGNIINNVDLAFLLGGGRDNSFENNIIMNSPTGSEISILGDSRDGSYWENGRNEILSRTDEIDYLNKFWQKKYPETGSLKTDNPELPKNNKICNNVIYNHGTLNVAENIKKYGKIENNISMSQGDLGFVDSENGNFKLREDSVIYTLLTEFKDIPFEKIGRKIRRAL